MRKTNNRIGKEYGVVVNVSAFALWQYNNIPASGRLVYSALAELVCTSSQEGNIKGLVYKVRLFMNQRECL